MVADQLPDWIAAQLPDGWRSTFVPLGSERMHVLEWGPTDGHAVLLLHGNPTWAFLWRKVVAALRAQPGGDRLRLIAPDLIGLGLSSKPAAHAHTLENHAAWLGAALDARIGDAPFAIAAQDWGGPIALGAASPRARRLRGIVLGNTVVGPPPAKFKPTVFHRLARLPIASDVLFRTLGFPLGVLHLSQGDRRSIRGNVARAYRWPLAHRADRDAPLALARMVPDSADRHPSIPQLRLAEQTFVTAQVPVALVWGMRDPILGRVVNHVARLRPDATVRKTEAGHFLQEEVPEPLAGAILDVTGRASWT